MRRNTVRQAGPARKLVVGITHELLQLGPRELAEPAVQHVPADPASVIRRVTTSRAPLIIIGVVFGHYARHAVLNHVDASLDLHLFELHI